MAITSYLDDFDVDPETKQVLNLALEMTRTALGLADDLANGIIAKPMRATKSLLFFAPRTRIGFGFPASELEYLILNQYRASATNISG